jgi:hypothetical protein
VSLQQELAPFHTLVKLIERELELAGRGEVAELDAAVRHTGAYMLELPVPPPDSARALIERARALRARVSIETQRLQESIAAARASKRRRKKVERSYARPVRGRYSASA